MSLLLELSFDAPDRSTANQLFGVGEIKYAAFDEQTAELIKRTLIQGEATDWKSSYANDWTLMIRWRMIIQLVLIVFNPGCNYQRIL